MASVGDWLHRHRAVHSLYNHWHIPYWLWRTIFHTNDAASKTPAITDSGTILILLSIASAIPLGRLLSLISSSTTTTSSSPSPSSRVSQATPAIAPQIRLSSVDSPSLTAEAVPIPPADAVPRWLSLPVRWRTCEPRLAVDVLAILVLVFVNSSVCRVSLQEVNNSDAHHVAHLYFIFRTFVPYTRPAVYKLLSLQSCDQKAYQQWTNDIDTELQDPVTMASLSVPTTLPSSPASYSCSTLHSGDYEVSSVKYKGKKCVRKSVTLKRRKQEPWEEQEEEEFRQKVAFLKQEHSHMERCSHHHLPTVLGVHEDERSFSIFSEPLADETLDHYLTVNCTGQDGVEYRSRLPQILVCLATTVQYLHELYLMHGDLKAANVVVCDGHHLHVIDLESMVDLSKLEGHHVRERVKRFTQMYSAPEVISHRLRGLPSDIYSLGLIFIEVFTTLVDDSLGAVRELLVKEPGEAVFSLRKWIQKSRQIPDCLVEDVRKLGDLIGRMIDSEPSARPSAAQVVGEMRTLRNTYDCSPENCKQPPRDPHAEIPHLPGDFTDLVTSPDDDEVEVPLIAAELDTPGRQDRDLVAFGSSSLTVPTLIRDEMPSVSSRIPSTLSSISDIRILQRPDFQIQDSESIGTEDPGRIEPRGFRGIITDSDAPWAPLGKA